MHYQVDFRRTTPSGAVFHGHLGSPPSLRDALDLARGYPTIHGERVSPFTPDGALTPRWATEAYAEFLTRDVLHVSIHFPEQATPASRRRLARLLAAI